MLKISPSSAQIWANCPGSYIMSLNIPDIENPNKLAGIESHERVKNAFILCKSLYDIDTLEDTGQLTADESEYCKYIFQLASDSVDNICGIETAIVTKPIGGIVLTGTVDFYTLVGDTLYIVDKKMEFGHKVLPKNNLQTLIYAFAIYENVLRKNAAIKKIACVIWQGKPNIHVYELQENEYSIALNNLHSSIIELTDASLSYAQKNTWYDRYLKPSENVCRYCPAIVTCPKVYESYAIIRENMQNMDEDMSDVPTNILAAIMADLLPEFPNVKRFMDRCEALALHLATNGVNIDGFTVKQNESGKKTWANDKDALTFLFKYFPRDKAVKYTPITPTQALNALKNHPLLPEITEEIALYIKKTSGKKTLVNMTSEIESFEIFDDIG